MQYRYDYRIPSTATMNSQAHEFHQTVWSNPYYVLLNGFLLVYSWAHSFGHILTKKHALARAFGQEKPALARTSLLLSFGRFNESSRFFIEYYTKLLL
jgi:hypothetical protein